MAIKIVEQQPDQAGVLEQYATISIAFSVNARLTVRPIEQGLGGLMLVEEPVSMPYVKDYDALDGEGPIGWRDAFDLSRWGILAAFDEKRFVGGAVVAWNTAGVNMLEGRDDLAVLWDLRVHPNARGKGVGHCLFAAAEAWARGHGCREVKVETQNNNVAACRFYARQDCQLQTICQSAYSELPDEVQLIWHKTFSAEPQPRDAV